MSDDGVVFQGDRTAVTVSLVREPEDERIARTWVDDGGDVHAEIRLTAGQERGLLLQTGTAGPARQVRVAEVRAGCSTRPWRSGGPGWAGPRTAGGGARRCTARRSR
jgi:hypothetical protein